VRAELAFGAGCARAAAALATDWHTSVSGRNSSCARRSSLAGAVEIEGAGGDDLARVVSYSFLNPPSIEETPLTTDAPLRPPSPPRHASTCVAIGEGSFSRRYPSTTSTARAAESSEMSARSTTCWIISLMNIPLMASPSAECVTAGMVINIRFKHRLQMNSLGAMEPKKSA
jgi:hypothetical protein